MAKLKISYPVFRQPCFVTFGAGSLRTLADAPGLDRTAFFLSAHQEVRQAVEKVLDPTGCKLTSKNFIVKPPGEPSADTIKLGILLLESGSFQRIVGIGGGSVLDWCRLAWAHSQGLLALDTGRVMEVGSAHSRPEIWLIPTTCGTGAEAASVAVYAHQGRKIPAVSSAFLADRVVLDGRFLDSIPAGDLACFLCDALSHAIESFVSIVPNYLAKEMACASLQLILAQYGADPTPSRHDRLMEAGYLGGVAASNCSVGVVHAFAHSLAAWGVGHGLANALGLIAGIEINAQTPAMQLLLHRLGHPDVKGLVDQLRPIVTIALTSRCNLSVVERLGEPECRQEILQRMRDDVCLRSNPQPLDTEQLETILDRVTQTVEAVS